MKMYTEKDFISGKFS